MDGRNDLTAQAEGGRDNGRSLDAHQSGVHEHYQAPPRQTIGLALLWSRRVRPNVWGSKFGLSEPSIAATFLKWLLDRREVTSYSGAIRWHYRGRYQDSSESGWLSESKVLDSVTPLSSGISARDSTSTPLAVGTHHVSAWDDSGPPVGTE